MQGCPLSVVLINTLMSVLTHCMFADDAYLLSRHSEAFGGGVSAASGGLLPYHRHAPQHGEDLCLLIAEQPQMQAEV